jgi:hypothetical protein
MILSQEGTGCPMVGWWLQTELMEMEGILFVSAEHKNSQCPLDEGGRLPTKEWISSSATRILHRNVWLFVGVLRVLSLSLVVVWYGVELGWVLEISDSEYEVEGRKWLQVASTRTYAMMIWMICWSHEGDKNEKIQKFDWFVVGHRSARRRSIGITIFYPFHFSVSTTTRARPSDIPKCQSAYVICMTEIEEWLKQELTEKERKKIKEDRYIVVIGKRKKRTQHQALMLPSH